MRADHDDGRFVNFDKQQPTEWSWPHNTKSLMASSSKRLRETYYITRYRCSWPLLLLTVLQGASWIPKTTAWNAMAEVFSDDLNLNIGDLLLNPIYHATSKPTWSPTLETNTQSILHQSQPTVVVSSQSERATPATHTLVTTSIAFSPHATCPRCKPSHSAEPNCLSESSLCNRKSLASKARKTRIKYQLEVLIKSNKSLSKYLFVNLV